MGATSSGGCCGELVGLEAASDWVTIDASVEYSLEVMAAETSVTEGGEARFTVTPGGGGGDVTLSVEYRGGASADDLNLDGLGSQWVSTSGRSF